MRFRLVENRIPVYRGVIKGLDPNVEGPGRAEWWTYDEDQATSYWKDGTDDEGVVLTSVIDLDKVNLIDLGKQRSVTDAYLSAKLNNILNTEIVKQTKDLVFIKYNGTVYRMTKGLDDLQTFYHIVAKQEGYDGLLIQFVIKGNLITEIALLRSGIVEYDAPDWYNKQWDK